MNKKTLGLLVDDRKFPTYKNQQDNSSENDFNACMNCTSTVCCTGTEGPIALSAFDVLRYATAFKQSPSEFMIEFTQDRFPDDEDGHFRARIESKKDSTVTFLRRKKVTADTHCIFTKFVKDSEERPRITCGLHEPRGLSCREFYFSHCRDRHTNELGAMVSHAMENIVDGKLTPEQIEKEIADLEAKGREKNTNDNMLHYTLREAREVSKYHGDSNYRIPVEDNSEWQDPIDMKLHRLLNTRNLRFEEDYGRVPKEHQLDENNFGNSLFKDQRLTKFRTDIQTWIKPETEGVFPQYFGSRATLGVQIGKLKPVSQKRIKDVRDVLETDEERKYYDKMMVTFNFLINFTSWYDVTGTVLEGEEALLPVELFTLWSNLRTSEILTANFNNEIESALNVLMDANIHALEQLSEVTEYSQMIYYGAMLYLLDYNQHMWDGNERYTRAYKKVMTMLQETSDKLLANDLYKDYEKLWAKETYTNSDLTKMYDQTLNLRYFEHLGLLDDCTEHFIYTFYDKATDMILPKFHNSTINGRNVIDVYNLVTHIGYGINQYNKIKLDTKYDIINKRINDSIWNEVAPALDFTKNGDDIELISEFCDATHTNLGFHRDDERYLNVMDKVAEHTPDTPEGYGQEWSGIKEGKPSDQDEYLYTHLYHRAWTVIDAMRSYFN